MLETGQQTCLLSETGTETDLETVSVSVSETEAKIGIETATVSVSVNGHETENETGIAIEIEIGIGSETGSETSATGTETGTTPDATTGGSERVSALDRPAGLPVCRSRLWWAALAVVTVMVVVAVVELQMIGTGMQATTRARKMGLDGRLSAGGRRRRVLLGTAIGSETASGSGRGRSVIDVIDELGGANHEKMKT